MDELFFVDGKNAVTVTQLNTLVHDVFAATDVFSHIAVRGEISNLVKHRSGHYYFSLKDEESLLRAIMFRSDTQRLSFEPENGMTVVAYGSLGSYVKDGSYRLLTTRMMPDGVGSLHLAFEKLKQKLAAEGLFAPERKKPIPKIPSAVGIVTSPTGAAVRDLIHVLGRRFPFAKVILYPALVQGVGAHESLIEGIETFCRLKNVDVIIIGRGGGSMEDLWEFNHEKLARAIAASDIPVISAVGHETDFTICDFVADLRAPTPSAAAELAVPDTEVLKKRFDNVIDRMHILCKKRMDEYIKTLSQLSSRRVLKDADAFMMHPSRELAYRKEALLRVMEGKLSFKRAGLEKSVAALDAMSPLRVLGRGYAVALKEGRTVFHTDDLALNEAFDLVLSDGRIRAKRIEGENSDE